MWPREAQGPELSRPTAAAGTAWLGRAKSCIILPENGGDLRHSKKSLLCKHWMQSLSTRKIYAFKIKRKPSTLVTVRKCSRKRFVPRVNSHRGIVIKFLNYFHKSLVHKNIQGPFSKKSLFTSALDEGRGNPNHPHVTGTFQERSLEVELNSGFFHPSQGVRVTLPSPQRPTALDYHLRGCRGRKGCWESVIRIQG